MAYTYKLRSQFTHLALYLDHILQVIIILGMGQRTVLHVHYGSNKKTNQWILSQEKLNKDKEYFIMYTKINDVDNNTTRINVWFSRPCKRIVVEMFL